MDDTKLKGSKTTEKVLQIIYLRARAKYEQQQNNVMRMDIQLLQYLYKIVYGFSLIMHLLLSPNQPEKKRFNIQKVSTGKFL